MPYVYALCTGIITFKFWHHFVHFTSALQKKAPEFSGASLLLCLNHRHHAAPTNDIDLFRGPHRLPAAAGTNQLPGGAWPFLALLQPSGASLLGRPSYAYPDGPRRSPGDLQLCIALFKRVFDQLVIILCRGIPAIGPSGVLTDQPVGLGKLFEFFVVIASVSADLSDAVHPAVDMYLLMYHSVQNFLDRKVHHFTSNIQLEKIILFPSPYSAHGAVAEAPRTGLASHDHRRELPAPKILVGTVVDFLNGRDGPAHFGCLFHGIDLHNKIAAKRLRDASA